MSIHRRQFLAAAGMSLSTTMVAPASSSASGPATDPPDWAAVRDQFEVSRAYIHLSSFFIASHPRPVREAIETHRQAIEDNPFLHVEKNIFEMPGKVRAVAAEYLEAKVEEVALTNSTTMGLAFIYQGLPLKTGDEVLTTAHDHFVHHDCIRLAASRAGASVRKIALYEDAQPITEEEIGDRIAKAVAPKTRAIGITWVHSGTGVKLPVRRIADAIAKINAGRGDADRIFLIVDGVHGFGVEDESVARLGCDFFAAGTHKWIFGPRGTGILWGRVDAWKQMRPIFPQVDFASFMGWIQGKPPASPLGVDAAGVAPGGFHAFEYEWALPAAFAFHQRIGRSKVADRIHQLNDQCKEGLAKMPHVRLVTPRGSHLSAGIICFDVKGMKPEQAVERLLARRILASQAPYAASYIRVAPSLLNSPEEVETTLREIRALSSVKR